MIIKTSYPFMKPPPSARLIRGHRSAQGLAGLWPFGENDGLQVFDLSGNNRTGTFVADTHFVPGKFGSCLDFDGTGDYVDVDFDPRAVIGSGNPFSFSLWINPGTVSGDQWIMGDATAGTDRFLMGLRGNAIGTGLGQEFDTTGITVSAGEWAHIFVTFDGSTTKVYKNAGTPDTNTFSFSGTYTEALYFGQISAGGGVERYTGKLDIPMVYNRVLSVGEIAELYAKPFGMFERRARTALMSGYEVVAPSGIAVYTHHYQQQL